MTAIILDGKALSSKVLDELKTRVTRGVQPTLGIILVGEDSASELYVRLKKDACTKIGGEFVLKRLPASAGTRQVLAAIDAFNNDSSVDGILLQLPLPKGIDAAECLAAISPEKDVDGLNPINLARIFERKPGFVAATAKGIMALLHANGVELAGKRAVVIGRSPDVGIPIAGLLLAEDATVTIAHSKTANLAEVCRDADIIVSSVGKAGIVTPEMVKDGAVVVDVGTNFVESGGKRSVVGDVDPRVCEKASYVTPVPGGVGPMTIASLLENLVEAAQERAATA